MKSKLKDSLKERKLKNVFRKSEKSDISNIYKVLEDDETENRKMKKVNILDRIKVIRFQNKNNGSKRTLNLEKIKDAGLIITAVALIGIGYANFSDNSQKEEKIVQTYSKSTNNIGDVELVSSNSVLVENDEDGTIKEENSEETSSNSNEELSNTAEETENISQENFETALVNNDNVQDNTTSISADNEAYFSKLKMERSDMYSKSLETYQKIVDSSSISNEQKAIAIQEIEKINKRQNAISVAEELIKLKGFDDVVIYYVDDSVSVIVRSSALSASQVAQIQNIVSKELSVDVSNITISNR